MHGSFPQPKGPKDKESRFARSKQHLAWIGGMGLGLIAVLLVILGKVRADDINKIYAGDVVVILIALDILTRFFTNLGALDAAALAVARATRGEPKRIVWGIGMLMFFISALLNNLAAVFTAAPIFLLILQQLGAGSRATKLMLALVLVNTNLGGAATPIGDFPAIILMATGVISFNSYLILAFPLCFCSAVLVTWIAASIIPHMWEQSTADIRGFGHFAVEALAQRMQFAHPDWARITLLSSVFLAMILAWATIPPRAWSFHYTAIAGAVAACIIVGRAATRNVLATYDMRTTIFMAITLAGAAIITATGVLDALANFLSAHIANPVALLFVIMAATTVAAALFQAGPAAAAMLPVISVLASGPLKLYGDWLYVAFAGSICAGSSMFVFSATSGPALAGEAQKAGIPWGIRAYLPYGIAAAVLQFLIVALWVAYAVVPGLDFWYALIGSVFILGGGVGIVFGAVLRTKGEAKAPTARERDLHGMGATILKVSIGIELVGIITKIVPWIW